MMVPKQNLLGSKTSLKDYKEITSPSKGSSTEVMKRRQLSLDKETLNSKRTENLVLFCLTWKPRTEAEMIRSSLLGRSLMM